MNDPLSQVDLSGVAPHDIAEVLSDLTALGTSTALKYLRCSCCGFLAVIPEKDSHDDLLCPFCVRSNCEAHPVGAFETISKDEFKREAEL